VIFLRSALFNAFFFVSTFLMTLPAAACTVLMPGRVMWWARVWAKTQIAAARIICGIRVEITGWENLPPPPVLIASRHESTFDVLFWIANVPASCFVVKRELGEIPLFGRCIHATRMISVDREAGASALRTLLREGDRAKAEGRHIIIFPEGTRVDRNEHPPLQPGVVALASRTKLPVVPVMTNSGAFWGRLAFRKLPGTISVAIQPGLNPPDGPRGILDDLRVAFDDAKLPPVR
jgi:1-acyl-sn-glycerol-3-phosphate acyltransferase